jgi:hypothetical protein
VLTYPKVIKEELTYSLSGDSNSVKIPKNGPKLYPKIFWKISKLCNLKSIEYLLIFKLWLELNKEKIYITNK